MEMLVAALMTWISATTGLPSTDSLPRIEFANAQQIWNVSHAPGTPFEALTVPVAVYVPGTRTIHLGHDFELQRAADLSVLVHEVVHHMQEMAGLTYGCRGDMEMVAYEAQKAFLESMKVDFFDVMPITPIGFKLLTLCHIDGY